MQFLAKITFFRVEKELRVWVSPGQMKSWEVLAGSDGSGTLLAFVTFVELSSERGIFFLASQLRLD